MPVGGRGPQQCAEPLGEFLPDGQPRIDRCGMYQELVQSVCLDSHARTILRPYRVVVTAEDYTSGTYREPLATC